MERASLRRLAALIIGFTFLIAAGCGGTFGL
jgi:hypothetical protein